VLERSFQPARALQLIHERRVTAMMGVPTQYAMLAADREWNGTDVSSLRLALVGGATMPRRAPGAVVGARRRADPGGRADRSRAERPAPGARRRRDPCRCGRAAYPHVSVRVADPESLLPLEGEATGELWCARAERVRGLPRRLTRRTARAMAGGLAGDG
jgi:fatty-acyl-CoA synthase